MSETNLPQVAVYITLFGNPVPVADIIAYFSGGGNPTGDTIRAAMEWMSKVRGELARMANEADEDAARGGKAT